MYTYGFCLNIFFLVLALALISYTKVSRYIKNLFLVNTLKTLFCFIFSKVFHIIWETKQKISENSKMLTSLTKNLF